MQATKEIEFRCLVFNEIIYGNSVVETLTRMCQSCPYWKDCSGASVRILSTEVKEDNNDIPFYEYRYYILYVRDKTRFAQTC